jgi:NAD(P)-dependent dehydrogenase (short-subunit alcohol dehydrogenase family)
MMMNKTAIVTGGSRGIGFAIAHRLGMDGYNVVILATKPQMPKEASDLLTSEKIPYRYVQGSIDNREDRERLLKETIDTFGRVDILVNNAGVAPLERKDLLEMEEESFDRVVGINTKGNMFMTQIVARQMISQKKLFKKTGTIINISSCSSVVSSTARGEYCVSKAGITMLTTLYADRLAREGILVHELRPGVIETDMTRGVHDKYSQKIEEGLFPIARWGKPEDVANAVSVFCSDMLLYTTGNHIDIDGGFHIQRL